MRGRIQAGLRGGACVALLLAACLAVAAPDAQWTYSLTPRAIAPGTWVVAGSTEHFSMHNGGNIANTAFIETSVGVVVIDTGPSLRYGRALREAIGRVTDAPVVRVYNTHHHPDHFLGNQAFSDVPVYALAGTRQAMAEQGEAFSDNLYRLLGPWMDGTLVHLPAHEAVPGVEAVGDHELEHFAFRGHTDGDLVLLDRTTGVLFAGDLVFHRRAPTTPNAALPAWDASLRALEAMPFTLLVPGHGPVTDAREPIAKTRAYLDWLGGRIDVAVHGGRSMAETLFLPVPGEFDDFDTLVEEYRRSVMHVFPDVEHAHFHGEAAP